MPDIIEPLTQDEETVLMIAAEGSPMAPIGRWETPVIDLARRGMLHALDTFNYVITAKGRAAVSAQGDQHARDLIEAHNRTVRARHVTVSATGSSYGDSVLPGPHVTAGRLFFKMPDGATIDTMIGEPWASEIIAMWRQR